MKLSLECIFPHSVFSKFHGKEKLQVLVTVVIKPPCLVTPLKEPAMSVCGIANICQAQPCSACHSHHSSIMSVSCYKSQTMLYFNQSGWKYNNLSNSSRLDNESTHCRSQNKTESCRTWSKAEHQSG